MRTTLNIDDEMIDSILSYTKLTNRSEAIRQALSDYIAFKKRQQLLSLRGEVDLENNWEELRSMEMSNE